MNRATIIELAQKHKGNMVYVWGAEPTVDNLDIFAFSKALIEKYIEEETIADEFSERD